MQNLFIYRVLVNLSKKINISLDQLQVKKAIILAVLSGTSNRQTTLITTLRSKYESEERATVNYANTPGWLFQRS